MNPQQLKTLSDHTRQQRLCLHLPQAQLAKQLGVQAATIYNWEHGTCDPARCDAFSGAEEVIEEENEADEQVDIF